jgi:transcriptional regulator with XRE-family HTH domain
VEKKREIGLRIRAHRLERRLTQEQLAESIDRSVETISNLERGVSLPNEATLRRLAQVLDASVDELFRERERKASTGKRSIESFRATEILRTLDEKKLKLAYRILKTISES